MSIETQPLTRFRLDGDTMGTRYSAVFYAPEGFEVAPLTAALFEAVNRVDLQMSTWKPASDLNRLNGAELGIWVSIPAELGTVLAAALRIERASQGAFDIGVGDLVAAWGFGAHAGNSAPVAPPMRVKTHEHLELTNGKARKTSSLSLDLSGIAKGFGVDELARVMNAFGFDAWLVGIDGEMRAKGTKPDGRFWAIAHEKPERGLREAMGVIELTDLAVATSGTYRHFRDDEGGTISHTINAKTGRPLANRIASVTVMAPTCMEADAWATALMVMGEDNGPKQAVLRGLDVIFVDEAGEMIPLPTMVMA
jgi:FAD:protein FMN transferase